MTRERSPAQLYAVLFGSVLLVVGIVGFLADSYYGTGSDVEGSDFIVFEVNGWHNIVHILPGFSVSPGDGGGTRCARTRGGSWRCTSS